MDSEKKYRYLFGPLPSRRFGRSLGVDLVPFKTCPLNCRFCQLGAAPTTLQRREYAPVREILGELDDWLRSGGEADFVSLGGSGEPTLHNRFGKILRWVREHSAIRTLLISNGVLFFLPDVRRQAASADVVKVSLHAWDSASFEAITRPDPAIRFEAVIDGLERFRDVYPGELRLEVFVVPGINDSENAIGRIAERAKRVRPDAVDLNTAVRPPADPAVRPASRETLERLAGFFDPPANVPSGGGAGPGAARPLGDDALVDLLARHPGDEIMLAEFFGRTVEELVTRLRRLARDGRVRRDEASGCWQAMAPKRAEARGR